MQVNVSRTWFVEKAGRTFEVGIIKRKFCKESGPKMQPSREVVKLYFQLLYGFEKKEALFCGRKQQLTEASL